MKNLILTSKTESQSPATTVHSKTGTLVSSAVDTTTSQCEEGSGVETTPI